MCARNSYRSQIAEAGVKPPASHVFDSSFAVTETMSQVNQDAVRMMKQLYGVDMEQTQRSKLLRELSPTNIANTMERAAPCPVAALTIPGGLGAGRPHRQKEWVLYRSDPLRKRSCRICRSPTAWFARL